MVDITFNDLLGLAAAFYFTSIILVMLFRGAMSIRAK